MTIAEGSKFGYLTVIQKDERKSKKNSYYLCQCDCGSKPKSIMRSNLLNGNTVSCGCFRKKRASKLNKSGPIDEKGNVYGRLTVVKRAENTDKGQAQWLCKCKCGSNPIVEGSSLRSGNTTSCGCKRIESLQLLPTQADDLTGQIFERLKVRFRGFNDPGGRAQWWCECICGNGKLIPGWRLRNNSTKSCGCLELENQINNCNKRTVIHGLHEHPLYRKFQSIKARCYNIDNKSYHNYGGKGVKVCEEWLIDFKSFYDWAMMNGWEQGKELSVDRVNNDGDYCPENCRIIPRVENTIKRYIDAGQGLEFNGVIYNVRNLKRKSNVSEKVIKKLINNGYSEDDVIKYGKLEYHQKQAVGRFITKKRPITIDEASKIPLKCKRTKKPPGHSSYTAIKQRCTNPKNPAYPRYGGRGIKMCDRWLLGFDNFIEDMGPPPYQGATIHRINNDEDYKPENCVWMSRSENAKLRHIK